jgi:cell division protein FtsQ
MVAVAIVIASIWGVLSSAWFAQTSQNLSNGFIRLTAAHGMVVNNLIIEGRDHVSRDGLKTLLNIEKNQPLLTVDLNDVKQKIEQLSWVKYVTVERRYPDTLYVTLVEREPIALWQRGGKLSVVDDEAVVLTEYNIAKFKKLLVVVGENAPQNTRDLLQTLEQAPSIKARVDAAKWVGNRRWDLTLDNKIIIRLPSENPEESLKRLATLHANDAVLDRPITSIDLRDQNHIVVQTTPGDAGQIDAVQAGNVTPAKDKDI